MRQVGVQFESSLGERPQLRTGAFAQRWTKQSGGISGCTGGDLAPFNQQTGNSVPGQVVGRRGSDDTAADDYDFGVMTV